MVLILNPVDRKKDMNKQKGTCQGRILLVDDDHFLLDFFSRVLTAQGFQTVHASNGNEAMQILLTDPHPFDLTIVDLLMPEMNGWKLIEGIRSEEKLMKLPVIALTGMSLSYQEYERIRQMANAVLLKGDFDISRFMETIRQHIAPVTDD